MTICSSCGSSKHDVLGWNPDFPAHRIIFCKDCGLMWTYPSPSQELLNKLYQADYRAIRRENPTDNYIESMDERARAQMQFILVNSRRDYKGASILDIGCSVGSLLLLFSELTDNLVGFEPDIVMAHIARRRLPSSANVYNQSFQSEMFEENTFDLITASHLLEHVPQPVEFLTGLFRLLRNNGILFLEVPNETKSGVREIVRAGHRGLMHLTFFDLQTLPKIIKRAGGEVVWIQTFGPDKKRFSLVHPKYGSWQRRVGWYCRRVFKGIRALGMTYCTADPDWSTWVDQENVNEGIWIRVLATRQK